MIEQDIAYYLTKITNYSRFVGSVKGVLECVRREYYSPERACEILKEITDAFEAEEEIVSV